MMDVLELWGYLDCKLRNSSVREEVQYQGSITWRAEQKKKQTSQRWRTANAGHELKPASFVVTVR
ncbi:MAG: hypothetical protein ACRDHW_09215, partial [Ktedonobacteraceae bacterium]